MKRTKTRFGEMYKEVQGSYATLYNIGKYIPGNEHIWEDFGDIMADSYKADWPEAIVKMNTLSKEAFNKWLAIEEPEIISKTLLPIRKRTHLKSFRLALLKMVDPQYKFYIDSDYTTVPLAFGVPTPFFVFSNKEEFPTHNKAIIIEYGGYKLHICGLLLKAEDCQLASVLMYLLRPRVYDEDATGIYFRTNVVELAKTLQKSNPWSPSTQQGIKNGLIRLRGCVITIDFPDGKWSIGGILTKATKLDEDELIIVMDKDYVTMLNPQHLKLDMKIYPTLPPIEANLYKYLMRQLSFNTYKVLPKVNNRIIYEQAGLGGIKPMNRSDYDIRRTLNKALQGLQRKGVLNQFLVDKQDTYIWNDKEPKALPPATKKPMRKLFKRFKCPWGYSNDMNDKCESCKDWTKCADKEEYDKSKNG